MAETDLKRGDIVILKSGSCRMTISEVRTLAQTMTMQKEIPDNYITVEWFWEGEIKSKTFYESQIKKIK